jgi:hypothetical protein
MILLQFKKGKKAATSLIIYRTFLFVKSAILFELTCRMDILAVNYFTIEVFYIHENEKKLFDFNIYYHCTSGAGSKAPQRRNYALSAFGLWCEFGRGCGSHKAGGWRNGVLGINKCTIRGQCGNRRIPGQGTSIQAE